jgi:hypothetical protein
MDPSGNNREETGELLNPTVDLLLDHLAGAEKQSSSRDLQAFPDFAAIPDEPMSADMQHRNQPTTG